MHGNVHRCLGRAKAPLDQLHGPRRHDWLGIRWIASDGHHRPLHLGQPPAIGANSSHAAGCQLDQHASQGIATRLVISGKHRSLHEFPHKRCCELKAGLLREGGHRGKLQRIFPRKTKLAARSFDHSG